MKFCFGDIVIVDENKIEVVVKSWARSSGAIHNVYVRLYNCIKTYAESDIERYTTEHGYPFPELTKF